MKKILTAILCLFIIQFSWSQSCYISGNSFTLVGCQGDNTYNVNGFINFENNPGTGYFVIEVIAGSGYFYDTIYPPFTDGVSNSFSVTDVIADTDPVTVNAYFTSDPDCGISESLNAPEGCFCEANVGTFETNSNGIYWADTLLLYIDDTLSIVSNDDGVPPFISSFPFPWEYDPGYAWLYYSCEPTYGLSAAELDPCLVGLYGYDDFADTNNGDGIFINQLLFLAPITFYSVVGEIYGISVNDDYVCYDLGPAIPILYLDSIIIQEEPDFSLGNLEVTLSGGLPNYNGTNFTISDLSPAWASLSTNSVGNNQSFLIQGLEIGDTYIYTVTDLAGYSIVVTGIFGTPISDFTGQAGGCQEDNTFEINGTVEYPYNPVTGFLVIEAVSGSGTYYDTIFPPFTNNVPNSFTISGIESDGNEINLTAYFTLDVAGSSSISLIAPLSCLCEANVGTFELNTSGNYWGDTLVLHVDDTLSIVSNDDGVPPFYSDMFSILYDPGYGWLIFSCQPVYGLPEIYDIPCMEGLNNFDDFVGSNLGEEDFWPNEVVYLTPLTFYSVFDDIYAITVNEGPICFDLGTAYPVLYVDSVLIDEIQNVPSGSVDVSLSGGLPNYNNSNFTISGLSPVWASLSTNIVGNNQSFTILGLNNGDFYYYTVSDDAGYSEIIGGIFGMSGDSDFESVDDIIVSNPATNVIVLKSSLNITEVELIDMTGRKTKLNDTGNNMYDCSDYASGQYFIRLITSEGTYHKKILINM